MTKHSQPSARSTAYQPPVGRVAPEYLSLADVARALGVATSTVRYWTYTDRLPWYEGPGGVVCISKLDVADLIGPQAEQVFGSGVFERLEIENIEDFEFSPALEPEDGEQSVGDKRSAWMNKPRRGGRGGNRGVTDFIHAGSVRTVRGHGASPFHHSSASPVETDEVPAEEIAQPSQRGDKNVWTVRHRRPAPRPIDEYRTKVYPEEQEIMDRVRLADEEGV